MKSKLKIMLTAFTVVAIVSGALAFKVKKSTNIFCTTQSGQTAGGSNCTLKLQRTFVVDSDEGNIYCTDQNNTECVLGISSSNL
jgi:hypothetical protein